MKSFYVIKGKTNRWFDQQGNEIPDIHKACKCTAEDPVGFESFIEDPNEVPHIKLSFYTTVCGNEEEVKNLAIQSNEA